MTITLNGTGSSSADTRCLQSAFDGAVADSDSRDIVLRGSFAIDRPLHMGGRTCLTGNHNSVSFVGAPVDEPLLTVAKLGSQRDSVGSSVQGINFYCGQRCRGLKFDTDTSTELLRDVQINSAMSLALDLFDCWASSVHGLMFSNCHGVGMRTHRCHLGRYDNVYFLHCDLLHHSQPASNNELWDYAWEHGIIATREHYGTDFKEHWPSDVAEEDRAILVLDREDLVRFSCLRFEPVHCADLPAIVMHGNNTTFEQLYFEGSTFSRLPDTAMIHVDGCANATFNQTRVTSIRQGEYLAKLLGSTTNAKLDGVYVYTPPHGLTTGIVRAVGSKHRGLCVERTAGFPLPDITYND